MGRFGKLLIDYKKFIMDSIERDAANFKLLGDRGSRISRPGCPFCRVNQALNEIRISLAQHSNHKDQSRPESQDIRLQIGNSVIVIQGA